MALFGNKPLGFMDVIRCDEPSYLIWKWHPAGRQVNNGRATSIRWGSSLRVKDGETAVFVYNQKNETYQDFIEGPFDSTLKTANLPVIASVVGLLYGGESPFQAEIYFINLAQITQIKFGVPFFDVYDPRFTDFGVPVAVRGTISFKINDVSAFIKLHRLQNFSFDDFKKQVRDAICRYVKDTVANAPATHNIPVVQIESKTAQINDAIEYDISERLRENFGVSVSGVDLGAIEIDKSSEGYSQLMAITQNVTAETIKAQTAVNIKQMQDKQRIEAENYAETLRVQREEAQYAQHKQTQTSNFAAYQIESQTQVGVAGAEALGKMGANGAGGVELGGGGFNPAAMMAGIALGGAVGQNIAGTMNGIMTGMNPTSSPAAPPPLPVISYHVAINGQAAGPFDFNTLKQMIIAGTFTEQSLVWKQGMAEWTKASAVGDLQELFNSPQSPPPIIPPIPSE